MLRNTRQVPISSKNNRAARSAHAKARHAFVTYDTSAIRPKKSKVPAIVALVVILVSLAVIVTVIVRSCTYEPELLPVTQEAIVQVDSGESAKDIAETLYEQRLIGNTQRFVDLVNSRGVAASLIPGTYLFRGGTSMDGILDSLLAGPSSTADVLVVPEGYTRDAIAQAIEQATSGRITAQSFLDATADATYYSNRYAFLEGVGDKTLEGFLFPKTYDITAVDDAQSVTLMMLDQFANETAGLDISYPESREMGWYDIVTLASIVQREGTPDTFGRIASVFYNRLDSDRPYLESDATTAYEVGHDPTPDEVHADTPYSTYTNEGLPPTPIGNPSLAALEAVCSPDDTNYMYFFSYDDGTYTFSETYEEHQSSWQ